MLSLRRDERKPWLVIRFSTCNDSLVPRRGFLGLESGFGTGATAITNATKQVFQTFSTPEANPPRASKVGKDGARMDDECYNNLIEIQRQMISDAAADERLSFRQMAEGLQCDGMDVLCPNQDIETLDKAHGSTRLISRTFTVDPFMKTSLEEFIFGKQKKENDVECFINVIQHSADINDVFENFVKQDAEDEAIGGLIRNLGMAKHRFASVQKRLGRFSGKINAMISTATWVRNFRPRQSKEEKSARRFLEKIDLEPYVQLSMMADGADDIKEGLVGFHDDEEVEYVLSSSMVKLCMDKLHWLFFQGGCLKTGYTKFALDAVKHVRVLQLGKNIVRSFGDVNGLAEPIINRCLKRMQAWYYLVQAVARVEHNDFESIASFHVLTVADKERSVWLDDPFTAGQADQKKKESMQTLSNLVNVDPVTLEQQLDNHKPIAKTIYKESSCTIAEAWRLAIERTQSHRERHMSSYYSVDALHPVLVAHQTFGGSSSGIEQGFSKALWAINRQQLGGSPQFIDDISKLLFDRRPLEELATLELAREIWFRHFGETRRCQRSRIDQGTVKGHKKGSESSWLSDRRKSVSAGVFEYNLKKSSGSTYLALSPERDNKFWTPSHEKEAKFQHDKLNKRSD